MLDDGFYLGVHRKSSKNLVFMVLDGSRWNVADSGIPPQDFVGVWRHLMGSWGPRGVEIWVDGVLRGTNPYTGGLPNPNYATILIGTDSWRYDSHSLIDEVVIYDTQRHPSQGIVEGSVGTDLVGGKPKCADFDCRAGRPCQNSEPLPEPVVDYVDLEASYTDRNTADPLLEPGRYMIWSGKRVKGYMGVSDDWKAYGPVTLKGGTSYLFDVSTRTLTTVSRGR